MSDERRDPDDPNRLRRNVNEVDQDAPHPPEPPHDDDAERGAPAPVDPRTP